MRSSTRLAALRAAARLALPFTLAGCGAAVSSERPRVDASTPDAAAPDVGEVTADVAPDAPPSRCDEADPGREAAAEAACCEAVVDAALRADAGVTSPRAMACCAALANWYDRPERRASGWITSEARNVCCTALNWQGSLTCTPWGPPVPPADRVLPPPAPSGGWLDLRPAARAARPALPPLPALYAAAVPTWRARMLNEHESSAVFAALAAQLHEAGLRASARECEGFAAEERRHGELCGAVVEALGGDALARARVHPDLPAHPGVDRREAALRNVLSVCCLSETVAVALIAAERLEMPAGELRDLLTRIFADEVGHARFGWTLLRELIPTLDPEARARLGAYLSLAFAHLESHELAHLPRGATPPPEAAALGLCQGDDARALFFDSVREVIVPALEALGLPASRAWSARVAHAA